MTGHLEQFVNSSELQRAAAGAIVRFLSEAIAARGVATLVLSGGSTPKAVFEMLGSEPLRFQLEWSKVHLFWGDERCVPPTDAESNFRMTDEALLRNISVPAQNVHRIRAERPPQEAAALYAEEITRFFKLEANISPKFDVTLLGLGEDGHTASLFPGTTVLTETQKLVSEVFVPKLDAYRISLTYPTINNSRTILFLISGASKAEILHEVLEGEQHQYPSQFIEPTDGTLYWFVDAAASAHLRSIDRLHRE